MEYIIVITIAAFYCLFIDSTQRRNSTIVLEGLLFLVLWLFVGTRFETGNDWMEYKLRFSQVPLLFEGSYEGLRMEYGYLFVNSLVKTFGGTVWDVFLLMAGLTLFILFRSVRLYTPWVFLAIFIYFRYGYLQCNMMFVRQGLVISIFLYALQFIEQRRWWRYCFLIVLSSFFHLSAVLLLPLYFFLNKEYSTKSVIIWVICAFVISQVRWLDLFVAYMPPSSIKLVLNSYLSSERWASPKAISFSFIERLVFFILISLKRDLLTEKYKYFNVFYNLFVLSFIVSLVFHQYVVFTDRIGILFNIGNVVLLTYLLGVFHDNSKVIYKTVLILFIVFWYLRYVFTSDVYLPYQSTLFH